MEYCYIEHIYKNCNCLPGYSKRYKKYQTSEFTDIKECSFRHIIDETSIDPNAEAGKCFSSILFGKKQLSASFCNCLEPCTEIEYRSRISQTSWPNLFGLQHFPTYWQNTDVYAYLRNSLNQTNAEFNNAFSDHIKDNLVVLDIFYEDLKFTEVIETAADQISSLISDLGGQLGLWLGMSIMTLVEIVFCLVYVLPKAGFTRVGMATTKDGLESK